jgi:hypothetical protein
MDRPSLDQALEQRDQVMRAFLDDDGRVVQIPAKMTKRLVVLDHVAQAFEVGRHYPEHEVNGILRGFYDDWAMLRRCLVDEAFLTRQDGAYWRSGGTVS